MTVALHFVLAWRVSSLRERLLERLKTLRPGTTMCPGRLSRDCGTTLRSARGEILALAKQGVIVLSQRGKPVRSETVKGPFRVRLC